MPVDVPSIVLPADILAEYYPDVLWYEQQYYVNQFPLITRPERIPVATQQFKVRHTRYRPRNYPIATTALNNTDTYSTITLAPRTTLGAAPGIGDASSLMAGDVLDLAGERVEVIATPAMDPGAMPVLPPGQTKPTAGNVLVRRGVEGTTVAAHIVGVVGSLVSGSRDGGEINQSGIKARPIEVTQNVQNWQYPVQVSGAVESTSGAYGMQPGSQFEVTKRQQLDNMMRDMERSSWYGIGEAPGYYSDGEPVRMKQIGIKNQVLTNQITATNGAAYNPLNFIQDVLQPLWAVGSKPDILMGGAAFLAGLTAWSHTMTRIDVGQTTLGVKIDAFESNLAPGLMIVPTISLNPFELFVGMSELIFWRVKQGETFWPRGTRGYAYEGDWLAEGAIELRDEEKHAFVTGITGFAAE